MPCSAQGGSWLRKKWDFSAMVTEQMMWCELWRHCSGLGYPFIIFIMLMLAASCSLARLQMHPDKKSVLIFLLHFRFSRPASCTEANQEIKPQTNFLEIIFWLEVISRASKMRRLFLIWGHELLYHASCLLWFNVYPSDMNSMNLSLLHYKAVIILYKIWNKYNNGFCQLWFWKVIVFTQ